MSNKQPCITNSRAIALPLVLVLLSVLALMAIAINFMSVSGYRMGNRSSDHLKAMLLAESLIAEAEAEIRHKLNNEYFGAIQGGSEGDLTLECSDGPLTRTLRADIVQEDTTGVTGTVLASYFDIDDLKVEARVWGNASLPGADFMRMITISATASVNGFIKQLHATYDIKVVDVRPVANEYIMHVGHAGANDFNEGHLLVVKDTGSKGISIDGSTTINLHRDYIYEDDWENWGDRECRDLYQGDKDSSKSLIPGGGSYNSEPYTNRPYTRSNLGDSGILSALQSGRARNLLTNSPAPGLPFEIDTGCSDTARLWSDPHPHYFNSGFRASQSTTSLFGYGVKNPTTIHGNVKKRWVRWHYEFNNIKGNSPYLPPICPRTLKIPPDPPCAAHASTNDWSSNDRWMIAGPQEKTGPYETSDSTFNSLAVPLSAALNARGGAIDFDVFKQSATRVKQNLSTDDLTVFSSNRIYPEGMLFLENVAELRDDLTNQTPGVIVARNEIKVPGSVEYRDAPLGRPGPDDTYFEKIPVLSLVGGQVSLGTAQVHSGIAANSNIVQSSSKIKGNVAVGKIANNQFGGEIKWDNRLVSECTVPPNNFVITMTPIVCAWVDTTNIR